MRIKEILDVKDLALHLALYLVQCLVHSEASINVIWGLRHNIVLFC